MKNYVVAIFSAYQGDITQYKVSSESEFEAIKLAMIESCPNEDSKKSERDFQSSPHYPDNLEAQINYYSSGDLPVSVIEI